MTVLVEDVDGDIIRFVVGGGYVDGTLLDNRTGTVQYCHLTLVVRADVVVPRTHAQPERVGTAYIENRLAGQRVTYRVNIVVGILHIECAYRELGGRGGDELHHHGIALAAYIQRTVLIVIRVVRIDNQVLVVENDSPDIIVRTRYAPRVGEDAGKVGEFLVFGERTHRVGHIDGIVAELGSGQVPYDVRNVLAELQFVVGVGEFRTFQCRGDVVGLTLFGDGDRTALDEYAIGDDSRVVDYLCGIGTLGHVVAGRDNLSGRRGIAFNHLKGSRRNRHIVCRVVAFGRIGYGHDELYLLVGVLRILHQQRHLAELLVGKHTLSRVLGEIGVGRNGSSRGILPLVVERDGAAVLGFDGLVACGEVHLDGVAACSGLHIDAAARYEHGRALFPIKGTLRIGAVRSHEIRFRGRFGDGAEVIRTCSEFRGADRVDHRGEHVEAELVAGAVHDEGHRVVSYVGGDFLAVVNGLVEVELELIRRGISFPPSISAVSSIALVFFARHHGQCRSECREHQKILFHFR